MKIMLGSKKIGTGTLKKGKVTITVKGSSLSKGKNKLLVEYVPSATSPRRARPPSEDHPHEVAPSAVTPLQ